MKRLLLKFCVMMAALLVSLGAWAATKTVTYTITSTSAVSTAGSAPSGSSATFANTYTTKDQLTSGKTMTLTLSGYEGNKITGITLSMKSNKTSGSGYLSLTAGTTALASIGTSTAGKAFSDALWNGSYTTSYTDVVPAMSNRNYAIQESENVVIVIGAITNSLYCQSFSIEYEDANAPTLQSISVKTAPKTTYMVGETFDPTGLIITKNMSDSSTEDVTYSESTKSKFTFSPSVTTELSNETQVLISYGGKTVNQPITVTAFVPYSGTFNISLNNNLYGVATGNIAVEQSKTTKGVTVVSGCANNASSKTFYDTNHIRYYTDSYLKLTAPDGFVITKVVLTEPSSNTKWDGYITVNNGEFNTKTWIGASSQVNFSMGAQNRIASIVVTYVESTTPIAITTPEGYSTFVCENAIVMPAGVQGSTVTVAGDELTLAWEYQAGDVVPAGTPILVKGTEGTHVAAITTGGDPVGTNYLVANTTGAAAQASTLAPTASKFYVLSYDTNDDNLGFYYLEADGASFDVPSGKVFLGIPASAGAKSRFVFNEDGEATAIESVETVKANSAAYNLAGQRVNANAKGIVIINGKKFYNK